jgi:hypothetical protein
MLCYLFRRLTGRKQGVNKSFLAHLNKKQNVGIYSAATERRPREANVFLVLLFAARGVALSIFNVSLC